MSFKFQETDMFSKITEGISLKFLKIHNFRLQSATALYFQHSKYLDYTKSFEHDLK